jgi:hypothetical protein
VDETDTDVKLCVANIPTALHRYRQSNSSAAFTAFSHGKEAKEHGYAAGRHPSVSRTVRPRGPYDLAALGLEVLAMRAANS